MKRTFWLVAPYVAWMALMSLLPQTAWAYATRGAVTAVLLVVGWFVSRDRNVASPLRAEGTVSSRDRNVASPLRCDAQRGRDILVACSVGLLVGILVFFVWIAPESWLWPSGEAVREGTDRTVYAPAVCGWALTLAKLCASAFVISVAEELFFRKWLVEFAGFGWMLVLFGVEHMRFDLGVERGSVFIAEGVFAGLCYGLLAKRYGILSAIIAHAVTNLILGLYVIGWDKWFYW